jgi:23S rRNA (uracil747-C5)-methyltransferase
VVGVESSEQAIESARLSAAALEVSAEFLAGDATAYALGATGAPDLVVVNPPRRGIGPDLAGWLEASAVRHVVYSSCNADSLARDLAAMPSLRPVSARLLDMFPHTDHHEVLVLLSR